MSQFVPLKIDTSSDEYREWSRTHKKEGNSIPILYVVRADGKTIYAKSGSLRGDDLPNMLIAALDQSGKVLPLKQAQLANETFEKFYAFRENGDDAAAVKVLSKLKKLGTPGEINSYAESIALINKEVQKMAKEVQEELVSLEEKLQDSDIGVQTDALLRWLKIKRDYGTLRLIKKDLAGFSRKLAKLKNLKALLVDVKIVDAARKSKSRTSKLRSIEKLEKLVASTAFDSVKERAKIEINHLQESISQ